MRSLPTENLVFIKQLVEGREPYSRWADWWELRKEKIKPHVTQVQGIMLGLGDVKTMREILEENGVPCTDLGSPGGQLSAEEYAAASALLDYQTRNEAPGHELLVAAETFCPAFDRYAMKHIRASADLQRLGGGLIDAFYLANRWPFPLARSFTPARPYQLLDENALAQLHRKSFHRVSRVVFSPDGSWAIAGHLDGWKGVPGSSSGILAVLGRREPGESSPARWAVASTTTVFAADWD